MNSVNLKIEELDDATLLKLRDSIIKEQVKRQEEKWNKNFYFVIDAIEKLIENYSNEWCLEFDCENCENSYTITWEELKELLLDYDMMNKM